MGGVSDRPGGARRRPRGARADPERDRRRARRARAGSRRWRRDARAARRSCTEHDLAALRAHPDHPGEEAPRDELLDARDHAAAARAGAASRCARTSTSSRPGTEPWAHGPWSGAIEGGCVHGRGVGRHEGGRDRRAARARGAARGGRRRARGRAPVRAVARRTAAWARSPRCERDARFDAALIPEPTGFSVVCAQAGALTFRGTVPRPRRARGDAARGRARRSTATCAIHAALAEHERRINADVEHPRDARARAAVPGLRRPRRSAGEWSSSVPDRLVFEGRVGVRVGEEPAAARAAFEAAVRAADGEEPPVEIAWTGGAFALGRDAGRPPVGRSASAPPWRPSAASAPLAGVPWGADMRLFTARGIPAVMCGTTGIELAHAVDERVRIDEVGRARADRRPPAGGDTRPRPRARPASRAAASAASSWRSTRSSPRSQKPGSARSMPTISPELLRRQRAAGGQQLEVGGREVLALLLVAAVDGEREQLPVGVGVDVARRVDEVGHVGPPGAVALGDLDRVAEQLLLRLGPQRADAVERRARPPRAARCGRGARSGSSRPGGRRSRSSPRSISASSASRDCGARRLVEQAAEDERLAEHARGLGQRERRARSGRRPGGRASAACTPWPSSCASVSTSRRRAV